MRRGEENLQNAYDEIMRVATNHSDILYDLIVLQDSLSAVDSAALEKSTHHVWIDLVYRVSMLLLLTQPLYYVILFFSPNTSGLVDLWTSGLLLAFFLFVWAYVVRFFLFFIFFLSL